MRVRVRLGRSPEPEPTGADRRRSPRLSSGCTVGLKRDTPAAAQPLEYGSLLDVSKFGAKIVTRAPVEVGQQLWLRATAVHVSKEQGNHYIGATWELPSRESNTRNGSGPPEV